MSVPTLHGYWRSSASYRVRLALGLKGVDYAQITYDLRVSAQRDDAYLSLAPQGLVPALEHDGGVFVQSPAILEWIEARWPKPALLPRAINDAAIVRAMVSLIGCDIHPLNNLRVLQALREKFFASEEQVQDWIAGWITEGFEALETLVARYGAGFAFGDAPSLADCALVPQVYNAERFEVPLDCFPRIVAAADALRALPQASAAHPDKQPDARAYKGQGICAPNKKG